MLSLTFKFESKIIQHYFRQNLIISVVPNILFLSFVLSSIYLSYKCIDLGYWIGLTDLLWFNLIDT